MAKVKICGLANYNDALDATNLGADFLGFHFIKESPKKVSEKLVIDIVPMLNNNRHIAIIIPSMRKIREILYVFLFILLNRSSMIVKRESIQNVIKRYKRILCS